jgi:hypothetical protein
MGQEFFINSSDLEDKVRKLLPSQGGAGAGFDLSASTQIIPIIDLTESAEGSNLRQDLQTSLSVTSITAFSVANATNTVLVNTTGYYRVFGVSRIYSNKITSFNLFDGVTAKNIIQFGSPTAFDITVETPFDFIVFLPAGNSLRASSDNAQAIINGNTRQIADIDGNLTNPV